MDTLPKGFHIATAGAGFRRPGRDDIGLIVSSRDAAAAGVFTTNVFKAAPVLVAQEQLRLHRNMRGILVNSGQANACTGEEGLRRCREVLRLVGETVHIDPERLLPISTGVIGDQLKMDLWRQALPQLEQSLGKRNAESFARAMMTTDTFPKLTERTLRLSGGEVRLVGMAKGAGMICPNMATMLSVVLCDAAVAVESWRAMFSDGVSRTFNRVSVDGDTSTNDTIYGLANGASGVCVETQADIHLLTQGLEDVLGRLAYMLVQDGEGATKVIHIHVTGAASVGDAEKVARTVGHSPLVKTALYGRDANWGRIVAAVGRSGAEFKAENVNVSLCGVALFHKGQPLPGNHDAALLEPLKARDVAVEIHLGAGSAEYTFLTTDLSHEYVSINADYRT